jgi:hypothetical protein
VLAALIGPAVAPAAAGLTRPAPVAARSLGTGRDPLDRPAGGPVPLPFTPDAGLEA